MKVIAIRHGETEGNVLHLVQSRTPGKLTAAGILQAREAADSLQGKHVDIIYCSDLQRCIDTALVVAEKRPPTPIVYVETLRERNQGIYEGGHWEDVPHEDFEGEFLHRQIPEGESWRDVEQRIGGLLNELYERHADETILLVTHGGPIKALRAILGGITLRESIDERVHNASVHYWDMAEKVHIVDVR